MKFKWEYEQYNPYTLQRKDYAELKKEYARLRKNVARRMKVFEKRGFERSEIYRRFIQETKPLNKIKNATELSYNLSTLAKIERTALSSYRGQVAYQKKTLASLHEHGYSFVNENNIWDFSDFMEEFRAQKLDELYDSKTATAIFEKATPAQLEAVKNDFETYLKRAENKEDLKLPKTGDTLNESDLTTRD